MVSIVPHIDRLQTTGLFAAFSRDELLDLFGHGGYRIRTYRKGTVIYLQNQACQSLDLLLRGEVAVQKLDEKGSVLTVTQLRAGDTMGGHSAFADIRAYTMTVSAKTDCIILHMEPEFVLDLCQRDKRFLRQLLHTLANKAVTISAKLKAVTLKTIRQSINECLAEEYRRQGTCAIKLRVSRKEWAELIGVQRPSLSRELGKMRDEGLIDFSGRWVRICDLSILPRE